MKNCKQANKTIYERNIAIQNSPSSPTKKIENEKVGEYSLKENIFDPSKSSPPNDFLLKLQLRMSIYNSSIKDEIRKSE